MSTSFLAQYGPWALVTGGANGIGRAFCAALAERGMNLIVVDILAAPLAEAASALRTHGVQVETVVVDLAAADFMMALHDALRGREVGLLVCSAADVPTAPFLDSDGAAHARAVAVNVLAPLQLTHFLAGSMRERGRGGVILLASMAALHGTGWVATYAATKAFNLILAESLWWELRDAGVDVLAVLPGATDTEGLRKNSPYIDDPATLGKPAEVAQEALAALGRMPSLVCGEQNRAVVEAMASMPRAQVIEMMSSATRLMTEGPRPRGGKPGDNGRR